MIPYLFTTFGRDSTLTKTFLYDSAVPLLLSASFSIAIAGAMLPPWYRTISPSCHTI